MYAHRKCAVVLQLPYATALAAVFIEGWIFVLLSVTGVRAAIIRLVPRCVSDLHCTACPLQRTGLSMAAAASLL